MTKKILKNYLKQISVLIDKLDLAKILNLKNKIKQYSKKNGKIFIFGNGGSASTANHFAVDMTKNAKIETHSISNDDLITCFSNDYGFDYWIKNAIKYYIKKNDFVIVSHLDKK